MKIILYSVMALLVVVSAVAHLVAYTVAVVALAAPTALLLWGSLHFVLPESSVPSFVEVLAAMYFLNLVRTLVLSGLVKPEAAADRISSALSPPAPKS